MLLYKLCLCEIMNKCFCVYESVREKERENCVYLDLCVCITCVCEKESLLWIFVCLYVCFFGMCVLVCVFFCVCVCLYVCQCLCLCVFVCLCVCESVCICVYV